MDLNIVNLQGKTVGQLTLDPAVWDTRVNTALLSQAIAMYRSNSRRFTASTKTRGNVSGGGKKPWKQKHTGRARAGSTRSPLWRHGGSVFGPRPRHPIYRLPQHMRALALFESLKGKVRDQELVVLDELAAETPKTKPFGKLAQTFGVSRRSIIVLNGGAEALEKSLRNLAGFELCHAQNLNAHDILNAQKIVLSKATFQQLEQRVRPGAPAAETAPVKAPTRAPAAKAAKTPTVKPIRKVKKPDAPRK